MTTRNISVGSVMERLNKYRPAQTTFTNMVDHVPCSIRGEYNGCCCYTTVVLEGVYINI